jgi:hypothetical protein
MKDALFDLFIRVFAGLIGNSMRPEHDEREVYE